MFKPHVLQERVLSIEEEAIDELHKTTLEAGEVAVPMKILLITPDEPLFVLVSMVNTVLNNINGWDCQYLTVPSLSKGFY